MRHLLRYYLPSKVSVKAGLAQSDPNCSLLDQVCGFLPQVLIQATKKLLDLSLSPHLLLRDEPPWQAGTSSLGNIHTGKAQRTVKCNFFKCSFERDKFNCDHLLSKNRVLNE